MPVSEFLKRVAFSGSLVIAMLAGAPAFAGRPIVVDRFPQVLSICALGDQNCSGNDITRLGSPFSTLYLYDQGIISFDQPLPETATVGDLNSLGTGNFFAPAFSPTHYQTLGVYTDSTFPGLGLGLAVNFYPEGITVVPPTEEDPGTIPLFQFQFGPLEDYYAATSMGFAYSGDVTPNALIAFNVFGTSDSVVNRNGLRLGQDPNDSDFTVNLFGYVGQGITVQDLFAPTYNQLPGVPEPSRWAMMLLGFGFIGAALRSVRRSPALA